MIHGTVSIAYKQYSLLYMKPMSNATSQPQIFKQISNLLNPNFTDEKEDPSNICEYYDIEKFCEAKFKSENYLFYISLKYRLPPISYWRS